MSANQKDVVCVETRNSNCSVHPELNFPSAGSLESCDLTEPVCFVVYVALLFTRLYGLGDPLEILQQGFF